MKLRSNGIYFLHRIRSLQCVTLLVIWIWMLDLSLRGFREAALKLGETDTFAILPFLQMDGYFNKVILLGVLCFFSNAPFMDRGEMYVIARIGRPRWGMRNIIYIFLGGICLALLIACLSSLALWPSFTWRNEWGTVYHTFSTGANMTGVPISGKALAAFSPLELMARVISIDALVFALLGMALYTSSLYLPRIWGFLLTTMLAFLSTMNSLPFDIWYFSPCSWISAACWRYGRDLEYPSLRYIYTALFLLLFLLGWAGQARIRRAQWNHREET